MGNGIQPQQWFYGGEPPTWNGLWSKNTGGKFGMPPLISNIMYLLGAHCEWPIDTTKHWEKDTGPGHRTYHNMPHAMGMGHCTPLPLNAPCPCLACDEHHGNIMGIAWESHGNIVGKMMKAFSSLVKLGCIIQQTGSRPLRERVCQTLESSRWQRKWPRIGQVPLSNSSYPTRSYQVSISPSHSKSSRVSHPRIRFRDRPAPSIRW